jgi:hypothetical protein
MNRLERLKLLFVGDNSLPNLGGIQSQSSSEQGSQADILFEKPSVPRQIPGQPDPSFDNFSVARSYLSATGNPEALEITRDEPKVFCPIQAIARLPYRYFKGDLSHLIAKKFFDEGKFWLRKWTL